MDMYVCMCHLLQKRSKSLKAIYMNRNIVTMDREEADVKKSLLSIKRSFHMILSSVLKKMTLGHNVENFRKNYCDGNTLLSLDSNLKLIVNF